MQQANWYVWASCSAWLTVVTPLGYCCCSSVAQSCPTPCDTRDCSPPGSSVHAILQARILEWVAMPSSRGPSQPRDWARVSCVGRQILYHWAPWEVSSGTLAIYPRPFACPSTSVGNFSAHLKGYLPQVFLEPIHLSSKLPLILLHYHFFDIVLILQITAAIWSYVFSPTSGSDCLNEQCSLPLFSESVYHGTQHWSSTQHPPLLSCKQNSSMWKVLWIRLTSDKHKNWILVFQISTFSVPLTATGCVGKTEK